MLEALKRRFLSELFQPTYAIGIWINPFFIIRRGLASGVAEISSAMKGGVLLDFGCGRKPYEDFFDVDKYIGLDHEDTGHDHRTSKVDVYYDGRKIPFPDETFDHVFSSETLEHVFNLDEVMSEISRVLKTGGRFAFTCPFVWDEHEVPYDYARYTSFAVESILDTHNFKIEKLVKSSNYVETIAQMTSAYIFQHVLPERRLVRYALSPVFCAPINIVGKILGKILPRANTFYLNNIVVARKLAATGDG
ncbi:class I SAM-dependent methyltransferase [Erythrobacter sp.]|uniref:class I SAM-dependent methyltransferase n=1 Tax=Erythrobacter sp. TaxID=1042 RepID=UPI001B2E4010|nr:class I SAM-dependent methyltransferase [Erythrobacter sp.]MBO6526353.1 class I SAM-dependent methyltransferase [Erythrobacter sp.]